jgi:hypothetical protein
MAPIRSSDHGPDAQYNASQEETLATAAGLAGNNKDEIVESAHRQDGGVNRAIQPS